MGEKLREFSLVLEAPEGTMWSSPSPLIAGAAARTRCSSQQPRPSQYAPDPHQFQGFPQDSSWPAPFPASALGPGSAYPWVSLWPAPLPALSWPAKRPQCYLPRDSPRLTPTLATALTSVQLVPWTSRRPLPLQVQHWASAELIFRTPQGLSLPQLQLQLAYQEDPSATCP